MGFVGSCCKRRLNWKEQRHGNIYNSYIYWTPGSRNCSVMLTYIESFAPYSNFIIPILQTKKPRHRDSKFTSVMEFRFEIRMLGSIICTLKRWKEWKKMQSSFSFILLFSSPITFLKYRAKVDRWAVRKTNVLWSLWRIWKGIWEE